MVDSVDNFTTLNDTIIQRIEGSREPELAKARQILQQLQRRKLYKLADQVVFF